MSTPDGAPVPPAPVRAGGRRRLLTGTALVVVLLLAAGAWVVVRGLLAQRHLETARASLGRAPGALADLRLDDAQAEVEQAGRSTARARALTGDPVWRLAAALPVVGDALATGRGVAVAADDLARSVLPGALEGVRLASASGLRRPDGSVDLERLREAGRPVDRSVAEVARVRASVQALPGEGAPASVRSRWADFAGVVGRLEQGLHGTQSVLELAPALLGEDRPRRFFVMVQQSAESRGTGGLIGGYAVVQAAGGRVTVLSQGSNADLRQGPVPPAAGTPADYVRRWSSFRAFDVWQQVNLSPDLPVVARNVAARWAAQGGPPVDGVVAVDAVALALLLRGSEPLRLADGQALRPDQLEGYLSVGQYAGVPLTQSGALQRKDRLSAIAEAVVARLISGGGSSDRLLRGLGDAVRSGHLRLASDDPQLRPHLAEVGLDGALPRDEVPTAYLVVANAAGGKLDQYLERTVDYALGPCTGGRRTSTVRARLLSDLPAVRLPAYVTFRNDVPGQQSRTNRLRVSVYGTPGARLTSATVDGQPLSLVAGGPGPLVEQGEEGGRPVWSAYLELPPDRAREVVLELDEPVLPGAPQVPQQPLLLPLAATVDAVACS